MSSKDFETDLNYKTPSGLALMKLARNPHLNVDVVHSEVETNNTIVQHTIDMPLLENGQSANLDIDIALMSDLQYSFNVLGYADFPLVETSVNRQSATICRVVVTNESGLLIPSLPITITATPL